MVTVRAINHHYKKVVNSDMNYGSLYLTVAYRHWGTSDIEKLEWKLISINEVLYIYIALCILIKQYKGFSLMNLSLWGLCSVDLGMYNAARLSKEKYLHRDLHLTFWPSL